MVIYCQYCIRDSVYYTSLMLSEHIRTYSFDRFFFGAKHDYRMVTDGGRDGDWDSFSFEFSAQGRASPHSVTEKGQSPLLMAAEQAGQVASGRRYPLA